VVEVSGDELASWLRNSTVRFVYLSCCEGAESPLPLERAAGWRRSLCKSLLEAGVAEVLAFFWEVDDAEAVAFTQTFYAKFFPGFDAPAALHAARLNCSLDKPIWASSVLAQRAGSTDTM
jgi:CHAT domain-containing protein